MRCRIRIFQMDNLPQQKNTAWTHKFWRDDNGPVCKSSFILQKIIEEKTCLQVYLKNLNYRGWELMPKIIDAKDAANPLFNFI